MWLKIKLYVISLWLLFLLLLINKIQVPICFEPECTFIGFGNLLKLNIIPTISLFFIILGIIFYKTFDYEFVKGATFLPKKVVRIENLNFETLSFLITYIVPLVCFDLDFDLDKNRNLIMLFLVLVLIGWIYVKANIFYTNPTLAVLGYKIYKIDTISTKNMVVIIKGKLSVDDSISAKLIDENIYYLKPITKLNAK